MLVSNFELRWTPQERTHFRLRVSNLESQPIEYALDLVLASNDPGRDLTSTIRYRFQRAYYNEFPSPVIEWHRVGERYLKTIYFTVRAGATDSIELATSPTLRDMATQGRYEGYAALRIPRVRDGQKWSRWTPQIGHPAHVLLAAEQILEQEPISTHIHGVYLQDDSEASLSVRTSSRIVHALPLATGASETAIPPEDGNFLQSIQVEHAKSTIADRLAAGDGMRVADRLDDAERLALLVDELQRLGTDPDAAALLNALLREQHATLHLCSDTTRDPRRDS
jgi:hypothetical protein